MARADLLLDIVRAGAAGDRHRFQKVLEALVAEERAKHHHILADRLAAHLRTASGGNGPAQVAARSAQFADPLAQVEPTRELKDLVLPPVVETACRELIEEQARADLLRAHNMEPRHRVLLAGPPGNGKTSLAEALASEMALPLLVVRYEAVIASYLGETAVRLARLFEQARTRRCVLFFDEFDVVGKERGDVHETGEIKRVVSSLLLQVDCLPSYVVVVAASNHPELLDRAVWRRFQLRLELPPPTHKQTVEWFKRFQERNGIDFGYAPTTLAKKLKGLSFSELEQFALDVSRRVVLNLPDGDARRIVRRRLSQWAERFNSPCMREGTKDA